MSGNGDFVIKCENFLYSGNMDRYDTRFGRYCQICSLIIPLSVQEFCVQISKFSSSWQQLCVLVYNCLHCSAPHYLQEVIQPVAEVTSRRRLRLLSSSALLGDRPFAVAGPRAWNTLYQTSSPIVHHHHHHHIITFIC